MIWTTGKLEKALEININTSIIANKVEFNSTDIKQDDIFIALPGTKSSGHKFVIDALSRGAKCAIVSESIENVNPNKLIKVNNTMVALRNLARYKRNTSKAIFIAITGTVGKTTTREITKTMLSQYGKTYSSRKNFNNLLGVNLTLASMPDDIKYTVIELGMNAPGEIRDLVKIVMPDIALITTISEGHINFFHSIEDITDAKCEIFECIDRNTGIAIINRDILTYNRCIRHINDFGIKIYKTFGTKPGSNIRLSLYKSLHNHFIPLIFDINSVKHKTIMPNISTHLASNFAASLAIVISLNLEVNKAISTIKFFKPLMGRGQFIKIKQHNKNLGIICDYYNSNPQSLRAGLQYLQQFPSKKKVAILGDMTELGNIQNNMHLSMVPLIIQSGVSKLFLVGSIISQIKNYFPYSIRVKLYKNVESIIVDKDTIFDDGEIVLIKASRCLRLENLVKSLGVKNVL